MYTDNEGSSRFEIRGGRRRRLLRLSVAGLLAVALVATGMFISGVVLASHNFSDVPTLAFYHSAVEWVFNRAITAGCAAGLYCPDNNVTRGQMAVFLRALGTALTPTMLIGAATPGTTDLDVNSNICQTTAYTPTFPQKALMDAKVSLRGAGFLTYFINTAVDVNGGGFVNFSSPSSRATVETTDHWAVTTLTGEIDLNPSSTYTFAIVIGRSNTPFGVGGTADAAELRCRLQVEIINRNPATSPLGPAPSVPVGPNN